jgi:hypothetical protein
MYNSEPLSDLPADSSVIAFIKESVKCQQTITDYYALALKPTLSAADEARLGDILLQATEDSLLSFWLDEADYWVAYHRGELDDVTLAVQQDNLKHTIGQTWVDSLWLDLQNHIKVLQTYLQRLGLYAGDIDGIMGPITRSAMASCQQLCVEDLPFECTGG